MIADHDRDRQSRDFQNMIVSDRRSWFGKMIVSDRRSRKKVSCLTLMVVTVVIRFGWPMEIAMASTISLSADHPV